jgi:ATP-dependent RNA helicase DDX3X
MAGWGEPNSGAWQTEEQLNSNFATDEPEAEKTFNIGEMIAALPSATGDDEVKAKIRGAGWTEQTPYDYEKYANGNTPADQNLWESSARIYEWDGEEGDLGPEYPELELEIFGDPSTRNHRGIDFSKIAEIEIVQEGPVRIEPATKFANAGLHPAMLRNVELAGYDVPTPIQMYCLPAIRAGHDVIGIAQTGSGKTGAYLIPILNKLMGKAKKLAAPRPNPATYDRMRDGVVRAEPLVVVVCPSRELAVQIFNEARKFCYRSMLRPCVVYGGGPIGAQLDSLAKGCDVLIASPGRLIDFMERPDRLTLRRVKYMVIDEADEMLHEDWEHEFTKILSGGGKSQRTITAWLRCLNALQSRKRATLPICSSPPRSPRKFETLPKHILQRTISVSVLVGLVAATATSNRQSSTQTEA